MAVTGFKRLGLAFAAFILAVVGVFATVPLMISPDTVREAVKGEVRALTGLDPLLRGDAHVSLFPQGIISFADVRLADGQSADAALTAERLIARLRVLPLLIGKVEIADVTLVAPVIRIDMLAGGRSNWSPLIGKLAEGSAPPRTAAVSEIRIERGTVIFSDKVAGTSETLTDVEVSLAWPSISKSFGATGRVTWRAEPLNISLTIGDFAAALGGSRTGVKTRIAGKPLKLAFDGAFSTRPSLKIEGTLAADAPSLRQVAMWSGQKPPPGGGFGRFSLKAQTSILGGTVAFTAVNVELDGNSAEGVLTLNTDNRQVLQGTLAADKLDLTPYLSTIKVLASNQREWDAKPIDISSLSGLDVDIRLSAAKVLLSSATLERTAIAANLRDGHLMVTIGESQGFGGTIKGSLMLAATNAGADVKAQMHFSGVDLESCLTGLIGLRRLAGTGDIALALDGSGSSVLAITRTLNGTATLSGRKGALIGLNVEQLLRRLERRPLSGGSNFRTGQTPYERIGLQLKVTDGTISVEDVQIEGSAVKLALAGTASIPMRELDLTGTAALVNTAGISAFELPFVVQGSWNDPLLLPDPQSLIRHSGAAAPLLDRRGRDSIRSAIERITGNGPTASQSQPVTTPAPAAQ
jgi:AsmA protein